MSHSPGLYVHVPFCSAICPYCDFAVLTGDAARRGRYVEHLLQELDARTELSGFDTLYFGGGTPSLLGADDLRRIRERAPLAESCRIYLEANPEDVSPESVASWRELGVDTLSLGVQAFDDDALSFLGRRHTAAEAHAAVETARDSGFDTVSIDMIFGLPNQPTSVWRASLERAIAHQPDHISCYQLTIHDGTLFGRRRDEGDLDEMPSDAQAELFRETHRMLADSGYEGYEVSNFARGVEHRSKHNQKYWDHTPYLGVGPVGALVRRSHADMERPLLVRVAETHRRRRRLRDSGRGGALARARDAATAHARRSRPRRREHRVRCRPCR